MTCNCEPPRGRGILHMAFNSHLCVFSAERGQLKDVMCRHLSQMKMLRYLMAEGYLAGCLHTTSKKMTRVSSHKWHGRQCMDKQ